MENESKEKPGTETSSNEEKMVTIRLFNYPAGLNPAWGTRKKPWLSNRPGLLRFIEKNYLSI